MIPESEAWLVGPTDRNIELRGTCIFGRAPESTVFIQSSLASRQHATIHLQGSDYWLVDLGSRNGTLWNERQVICPIRLQDGDRIEIADQRFCFRHPRRRVSPVDLLALPTEPRITREAHWLMVADISEFTPLSQTLTPEQLAQTVNGWLAHCRGVIEAEGGQLNSYTGDGFLAHWRDDANAAPAVSRAIGKLEAQAAEQAVTFRVVVHLGTVGLGGIQNNAGQVLHGAMVNFTFRLEKVAASLNLAFLFSAAAAARLVEQLSLEPVEKTFCLKGFAEEHQVFRLKP